MLALLFSAAPALAVDNRYLGRSEDSNLGIFVDRDSFDAWRGPTQPTAWVYLVYERDQANGVAVIHTLVLANCAGPRRLQTLVAYHYNIYSGVVAQEGDSHTPLPFGAGSVGATIVDYICTNGESNPTAPSLGNMSYERARQMMANHR